MAEGSPKPANSDLGWSNFLTNALDLVGWETSPKGTMSGMRTGPPKKQQPARVVSPREGPANVVAENDDMLESDLLASVFVDMQVSRKGSKQD